MTELLERMMRRLLLMVFGVTVLVFTPSVSTAQTARPAPTDTIYEIILTDGSTLFGRVVEQDAERLVVVTASGTRVEVKRTQIERMRMTAGRAAGEAYWSSDPNLTRLLFTSTARPLPKGEGYISSFMLFFPFVAYGVTDRLTLAGGTPIIPEAIGKVLYFAPKYTVLQRPKADYAIGMLGFVVPESLEGGSAGIVYGVGTWGTPDRAITAGAGWGYFTNWSDASLSNNPVIVLGGEQRISRSVKLVTENWLPLSASSVFATGGVRFIGERITADLGIGGFGETGCCLPLVNFVYNFGGKAK